MRTSNSRSKVCVKYAGPMELWNDALVTTCEGWSRRRWGHLQLSANTVMLRTACFLCVRGLRELLDRVLHEVAVPAHLRDRPYLRPIYDHPQFLVRNIWRLYGGWYDGEPDNLLPAPRVDQARLWVDLAGGVQQVLDRAAALKAEGNLRLACHAIEFVVLAAPDSQAAHALRADIYATRAALEVSSMG